MSRTPMLLHALLFAVLLTLALHGDVAAQPCPNVPADAFAFINSGSDECPANPEVSWPDATTQFDCSFFTNGDTAIDCSGSGETCVNLCRNATNIWNTDLPGRFKFVEANGQVNFCDTEDGKVSVGGTTELCDGSNYGPRVLAVTLSIFFSQGPQAGQLIDANITVNQDFSFTQAGFQATLAHEFGHVLGLSHPDQCSKDFNVLMRSASLFSSQSSCFVLDPTSADLNGAKRLYPVVNPTPVPTLTPTPVTTPNACGDADGSGSVSVTDGVIVLNAAAGLPSTCVPQRCDVDGSGSITITDGVHVLRAAAGLETPNACP
jgi:hypothetical protein